MNPFKKKELEQKYIGQVIRIIDMVGEPDYTGAKGEVEFVDDIGQLHGTWGGLAIDLTCDKIEILEDYYDI